MTIPDLARRGLLWTGAQHAALARDGAARRDLLRRRMVAQWETARVWSVEAGCYVVRGGGEGSDG